MTAVGNSLISDEELQKALAEVEAGADGALDDGRLEPADSPAAGPGPASAVPVLKVNLQPTAEPADAAEPRANEGREATANSASAADLDAQFAAAAGPDSKAGAPPAQTKKRFTVNRKSGAAAAAAVTQATAALAAMSAAEKAAAAPQKKPWNIPKPVLLVLKALRAAGNAVYRFVDRSLELLSWPVQRLSPLWRNVIGASGIVACLYSLVLIQIAPSLRPKRDAITFVHEKREDVEHPKPKPKPAEAEGETGGTDKAEGHGEKKAEKKPEKKPEKKAEKPAAKEGGHGGHG